MYAIVPAHNEAPSVGAVVATLLESRALQGVVVVDDGSTDETSDEARAAGAHVVTLTNNVGKGEAMLAGVAEIAKLGDRSDRIMFMDADLVGLRPEQVRRMISMSSRGYDQVGAIVHRGHVRGLLATMMPMITGQRVVKKWVLEDLPQTCWQGYSIEVALNDVVGRHGGTIATMLLFGVGHRTKLRKSGMLDGMRAQLRMIQQLRRTKQALVQSGGTSCAI